MPVIPEIADWAPEATEWRRALHQIPELDFDLPLTAAFVAERLREIGVDELHEGLARTGMVALIHGRGPGPVIGLRADMDALPIHEETNLPWRSRHAGRMHACGHDGHTTILLSAARYLAAVRNFCGSVALIFQPSEEMSGGARVMCQEGLMDRFGIARVFGLHNLPGRPFGQIAMTPGPTMAAADEFTIRILGRGGHAANPQLCIDPVPVALQLGQAMQVLTSRETDPLQQAVVSLCVLRAGTARNVIPSAVELGGTVRTLDEGVRQHLARRIEAMAHATAAAFGARAEVEYRFGYPMTVNDPEATAFAASVAAQVVGESAVVTRQPPLMVSEDFAYMLQERPGAYVFVGTGDGPGLHHPAFDYNDAATPIAASYFVRLVETAQPLG